MSKKVQYSNMLKQALNEWDTSKTVDVKGPMLDDILSYDGGEHLKTHKDAASILERYYFNENLDKGVEVNDDATSLDSPSMDHAEGEGTDQAGTSDKSSIDAFEDEIEKEIAAEMASLLEDEDKKEEEAEKKEPDGDEEGGEAKGDHKEPDGDEKKEPANEATKLASEILSFLKETEEVTEDVVEEDAVAEAEEVTESDDPATDSSEPDADDTAEPTDENTIIERLIAEMEEENKASDSMEHAEGAGTEQAGTGDDAKEIPDRKDDHMDYIERPKLEELMRVLEADEEGDDAPVEDADAEKKTNLDVDKKVKESVVAEDAGVGGGPLPAARRKKNLEDQNADQAELEEAFRLFEAMEEDDTPDKVVKENPKNMRV